MMPCLSKTARPQISAVSLPVSPAQTVSPFLQRCWTLSCPNLPASRSPLRRSQSQTAARPTRRRCLPDMPKQKTIAELNAEKEKIEQQLFKLAQTMPNCHSQKTRGRRAEKHPQNRLSVNHFGNHFPLFLPSFWPVNHLRTTKNWMKSALVLPNLVKPYQPV